MYCPKCGSRLYPDDEEVMNLIGVCGNCLSWDRTPDRRYQTAYKDAKERKAKAKIKKHYTPFYALIATERYNR